jgi:hypothetical protein
MAGNVTNIEKKLLHASEINVDTTTSKKILHPKTNLCLMKSLGSTVRNTYDRKHIGYLSRLKYTMKMKSEKFRL